VPEEISGQGVQHLGIRREGGIDQEHGNPPAPEAPDKIGPEVMLGDHYGLWADPIDELPNLSQGIQWEVALGMNIGVIPYVFVSGG